MHVVRDFLAAADPDTARRLLALLVAALAAFTVQQAGLLLHRAWPRTGSRLAALTGRIGRLQTTRISIGSDRPMEMEPANIVLSSLGLPAGITLAHLRLAGAVWPLPALLLGMPPLPVLAVCALSGIMVHSWLAQRWASFVTRLEEELGPYAGHLHSTLQVTESVHIALERSIDTLEPGSPLRVWMDRLALGLTSRGTPFLLAALPAARAISPSLALIVLLLERCASSGGKTHTQAVISAARQMGEVTEARTVAHAKAGKARGTVTIFLGLLVVLASLTAAQPQLREGFRLPIVQIAIAGSLALLVVGYLLIQAMIRDALAA